MFSTSDVRKVHTRWLTQATALSIHAAKAGGTDTGHFLTWRDWGQHLLHKSRKLHPWNVVEERKWMQCAARVFPVNSYLRRIDKHPTGDCPWCGAGNIESLTHFMSVCPQFALNCTAPHHAIARATIGAMREAAQPGWIFYYETTITDLPFDFDWPTLDEAVRGNARCPDGVAWNPSKQQVCFLEFTRCMDHPDTYAAALEAKRTQYVEEMCALYH